MADNNPFYSVFIEHLSSSIDQNSSIEDAVATIDASLQGGDVAPHEITTLTSLKHILGYRASLTFWNWILAKPTGDSVTISQHVASVTYSSLDLIGLPSECTGDLSQVRAGLVRAEPMTVFYVIMSQKIKGKKLPTGLSLSAAEFSAWLFGELSRAGIGLSSPGLSAKAITAIHDTMSEAAAAEFEPHFESGVKFTRVLQGLCQIVQEPEDVFLLYDKGYHSIRSIAAGSLENLKEKLYGAEGSGQLSHSPGAVAKAAAIHRAAQKIDRRNENAWISAMEPRRSDFVPLEHPGLIPKLTLQQPKEPLRGSEENSEVERSRPDHNLTDIFLLEDATCEICCSKTSLTAYFAALMGLLQRTMSKPDSNVTLLDVLGKRRPDLAHLELTCANSKTQIPYIALINEALESYIRFKAGQAKDSEKNNLDGTAAVIPARNTAEDSESSLEPSDHESVPSYQTGNTDEFVYSELVSKQFYPFSIFPYKKAYDDVNQIMDFLQVPWIELIETFRDRDLLLTSVAASYSQDEKSAVRQQLVQGLDEVFARQIAAESLGLKQQDFAAITNETFSVDWFADLLQGLSKESSAITVQSSVTWSTSSLWGYGDTETMTETSQELGLSFIKSQLMRRTGLEFQDILDLVKTRCFSQDLVIVNHHGREEFNSSLGDLRLLACASNPLFNPLTEKLCFRLQAFIRLRAKLGWSTKCLDDVVVCLRTLELESTVPRAPKTNTETQAEDLFAITPFVIKGLAAISKLSALYSDHIIEDGIVALLPLWGQISAYGEDSLLYTRFLVPSLQRLSPFFNKPPSGSQEYLTHNGSYALLGDVDNAVCAALQWPLQRFKKLRKASGLDGSGTQLTLDTLSALYRHVLLCRILSIAPEDCVWLLDLFSKHKLESGKPLDNPMNTLAVIEKFRTLFNAGWTCESLRGALAVDGETNATPDNIGNGIRIVAACEAVRAGGSLHPSRRAATICEVSKLTAEELQSIHLSKHRFQHQTIIQVDLNNPSLDDLLKLVRYRELKDACVRNKIAANRAANTGGQDLISLFEWLCQTNTATISETAARVNAATGWSVTRLDELLRYKYEDSSSDERAEQGRKAMLRSLSNFQTLLHLQNIMAVDYRLVNRSTELPPPIGTLMTLAQPKLTLEDDNTYLAATRELRARLTVSQASAVDVQTMLKRRNALVAYLLQQTYVINQGITDADGLLQYLLLDVQMGLQLRTSRIKQAISVVQVFVERCLLGLEDEVEKSSLVRKQWKWMQKYSLWEAHVKLLLRPEN
jgi:hypothetical protein